MNDTIEIIQESLKAVDMVATESYYRNNLAIHLADNPEDRKALVAIMERANAKHKQKDYLKSVYAGS